MSSVLQMPSPPRRKATRPLLALLVLLLFVGSGCGYWLYAGRMESEQGIIQATLLPVQADMSAKVAQVLVRNGERVKAGQPLLRLDGGAYLRQEAEARALVRGSYALTAEETAERVAAAQAAEEYMVRRVTLARHEEESRRQALEQSSAQHAKAQLRMRDMAARSTPAQAKASNDALKEEEDARQRLDKERADFESASRSRAAIEGELLRAKLEVERSRQSRQGRQARPRQATMPGQSEGSAAVASSLAGKSLPDPTLVLAPEQGSVSGPLPQPGQMVNKGQNVAHLIPAHSEHLWATALISQKEAARVREGQLCYLLPIHAPGLILRGEIEQFLAPEQSNAPGRPLLTSLRVRITDPLARQHAASLAGQNARLVVWTNALPGMQYLAPVLAGLSTL